MYLDNTTYTEPRLLQSHISKYDVEIEQIGNFNISRGRKVDPTSVIGFRILLKGRPQMYLISVYMPSIIFVMISWIR